MDTGKKRAYAEMPEYRRMRIQMHLSAFVCSLSDEDRIGKVGWYSRQFYLWAALFHNLSERGRGFTKTMKKCPASLNQWSMKVLFENQHIHENRCRNGIIKFDALLRLTQDNLFSFSEVPPTEAANTCR